jgi:hypothetical protein
MITNEDEEEDRLQPNSSRTGVSGLQSLSVAQVMATQWGVQDVAEMIRLTSVGGSPAVD